MLKVHKGIFHGNDKPVLSQFAQSAGSGEVKGEAKFGGTVVAGSGPSTVPALVSAGVASGELPACFEIKGVRSIGSCLIGTVEIVGYFPGARWKVSIDRVIFIFLTGYAQKKEDEEYLKKGFSVTHTALFFSWLINA